MRLMKKIIVSSFLSLVVALFMVATPVLAKVRMVDGVLNASSNSLITSVSGSGRFLVLPNGRDMPITILRHGSWEIFTLSSYPILPDNHGISGTILRKRPGRTKWWWIQTYAYGYDPHEAGDMKLVLPDNAKITFKELVDHPDLVSVKDVDVDCGGWMKTMKKLH